MSNGCGEQSGSLMIWEKSDRRLPSRSSTAAVHIHADRRFSPRLTSTSASARNTYYTTTNKRGALCGMIHKGSREMAVFGENEHEHL